MKYLLTLILLASCTTTPPVVDKPAEEKEYPLSGWKYTALAENAVRTYGTELLKAEPKDIADFCGNWKGIDRVKFYEAMLAAMAKRESAWDPTTKYTESFSDAKGVKVVSRGLLQISIESANQSAYKCNIKNANELHDPSINLNCGVKILNYWAKDGYLAKDKLGAGRYWSTMRPGTSKEYIRNKLKEFCNART